MKKVILLSLCLFLMVSGAFAAVKTADKPAMEKMTINGTIIDNLCGNGNKANIGEFIKTHTKDCALMPACVASGYSIYADGKLTEFDKASTAKIEKFLKGKNSMLKVQAVVKKDGDKYALLSIKNQKM